MASHKLQGLPLILTHIFSFTVMVVLAFSLRPSPPSAMAAPPKGCFSKIYAFGDSYTDTGNTDSITGPSAFRSVSNPPYGQTFFHKPTNRYSDGRLVVDFLAQSLGLPLLPPYLHNRRTGFPHGANFAYAGSTAIDYDFFIKHNISFDLTTNSLQTQLHWFNSMVQSTTPDEVDAGEALFWVGEIGANDYAYSYASSVPYTTITDLAVNNTLNFLQALLNKGAKHIVVQGLPLLGCLPLTLILAPNAERDAFGCAKGGNDRTDSHNAHLLAMIHALRSSNPDATILYLDYANAHRKILEQSKDYGFEEPIRACCGSGGPYNFDITATCGSSATSIFTFQRARACTNPRAYMNWDGVHFTEAMYKVLWELFSRGGYSTPAFDTLFGTKKCLGSVRRAP